MKFSVAKLLLLTLVISALMAIVAKKPKHPKEVVQVIKNLQYVDPNARTKDVCDLLVVPFRPADYKHMNLPIYYIEIDANYRLAIEFEQDGFDQTFRSAQVQHFIPENGEWRTIYPIREKFVMIEKSGRKIACPPKRSN